MKYLLALLLAFAALPADAGPEWTYNKDGLRIELFNEPCDLPVAFFNLMMNEVEGEPKRAIIHLEGKALAGCWGPYEDKLLVGDELGRGGFIWKHEVQGL